MKIYVDASARCDGDGSEFRPFKRINEAAKIAVAGDEVLVKPGIYSLMIITHIQHRFMGIGILPRMKNIQAVFI